MSVVLIGTLDTKGVELGFVRDVLRESGLETLVIDAGSLGPAALTPDIGRDEVFRRAGCSAETARDRSDRAAAVSAAATGVTSIVRELDDAGRVDGVLAIGGSAGTVIGTAAMRALPFGRPKVMVSTVASGQVRAITSAAATSSCSTPSWILPGSNSLTRIALANAAHAMAGMVRWGRRANIGQDRVRPVVAATMFGVTTPCVERARTLLEAGGCEVIVFHATGVGGRAMEGLIREGMIDGVLDLTTTELADELVGGTFRPARTVSRRPGVAESPRSSVSVRSTWSISGRDRLSPKAFGAVHSTFTTRSLR